MSLLPIHRQAADLSEQFNALETLFDKQIHRLPKNRYIDLQFTKQQDDVKKLVEEVSDLKRSFSVFCELKKEVKQQKRSYKTLAKKDIHGTLDPLSLNAFASLSAKLYELEAKIKTQRAEASMRITLLEAEEGSSSAQSKESLHVSKEVPEKDNYTKVFRPGWLLRKRKGDENEAFSKQILSWFEKEVTSGQEVIFRDAQKRETPLHRNGTWIVIHQPEGTSSPCVDLIKKAVNHSQGKWKFSYQLPVKEGQSLVDASDLLRHFKDVKKEQS